MLYHRTILEPHKAYPIPAGTYYIVLTVQKTAFGLDIIPESLLPQLIQKGFHVGDFRKMKKFNQTPYKLPPPTPIDVPAEKRPLEENALPKKRVRITPVMRCVSRRSERPMAPVPIPQPPVQIPDVLEPVPIPDVPLSPVNIPQPPVHISDVLEPPMQILPEPMNILHIPQHVQIPVSQVPQPPVQILHVSEPVQIPVSQVPQPPVQIPVSQVPQPPMQILPEPMQLLPELDMLDPLESTDAFDQLMSFVFGPQELQLLHTVPSIFDENLFSFLDEREPMDLTMPRLNSCVKNIGPIQPMDLSVNSSIGQ
ncbi:uncharacterized protein TNCV_830421 [Trichonephila clavipes]|nr:uncharacterized protein TNCV_830421 [Trichonephila clavipes]